MAKKESTTGSGSQGKTGSGSGEEELGSGGFRLPLIGHLPYRQQMKIVGAFAGVTFAFAAGSIFWYQKNDSKFLAQETVVTEMSTLAQKIGRTAGLAAIGKNEAFTDLAAAGRGYQENLLLLEKGGEKGGRTVLSVDLGQAQEALKRIDEKWHRTAENVAQVVKAKDTLAGFGANIRKMNEADRDLDQEIRKLSLEVAQKGADSRQQKAVDQMGLLVQRMSKNANVLLAADALDQEAVFLLGKETNLGRKILTGLVEGSDALTLAPLPDAAKESAASVRKKYDSFADLAGFAQKNYGELFLAKQARIELGVASEELAVEGAKVAQMLQASSGSNQAWLTLFLASGAIFLLAIVMLGKLVMDEANEARKNALSAQENRSRQTAIMQMLEDLSEMATGDLTRRVQVNDTFTGALADAINAMASDLRGLILRVTETSQTVDLDAQAATKVSGFLRSETEAQHTLLNNSATAVRKMSEEILSLTDEAKKGMHAALQSSERAQKGVNVSTEALNKMNLVRDAIQESAKRVKLLGESSTAVGEVTTLIRDITKQINILALNAAIQAAAAGEMGRGFGVVAQEVQRLALSSAEASTRIDDIIQNIQSDAKEAVATMERTTAEVVEGTALTAKTSAEIQELGNAAKDTANAMSDLSGLVQLQSEQANYIAVDMDGLQEKTAAAQKGVEQAIKVIDRIKDASQNLVASVKTFKT